MTLTILEVKNGYKIRISHNVVSDKKGTTRVVYTNKKAYKTFLEAIYNSLYFLQTKNLIRDFGDPKQPPNPEKK